MESPRRFMQTKPARPLIVIAIIIAALFLSAVVAYAQSGAFVGIETITCDETGYSITITPDPNWTQSWCTGQGYTYSPGPTYDMCYDNPITTIYQLPPLVRYAPASDPLAETWANLGKDTATIYYNIRWTYSYLPLAWVNIYYPTGPSPGSSTVAVTVNKADCLAPPSQPACELTQRYYMYTLEDANQPAGWAKYCHIISFNGYPSTDIQAKVCSPLGSDYKFRATYIPFGGWVSTDCQGNIYYDWSSWDSSWYRSEYVK